MSENKSVSLEQAAQYIGVKPVTLRLWQRVGRSNIPYYRLGRLIKFRVADLDDFLESRRMVQA